MDSDDRREFDRLYRRLIVRVASPARHERQVDALSLAELQELMDRVRQQESATRDTDDYPVAAQEA
jgi:hypothetical protein